MKDDTLQHSKIVNIDTLHPWENNPRTVTKAAFERVKKQLSKLGQYKPLIVTRNNEIIGGCTRYEALKSLGVEKVWVNIVDAKTDTEKMEYLFSDNDQAGTYDSDTLFNFLPEIDVDTLDDYTLSFSSPLTLKQLFKIFPENPPEENLQKTWRQEAIKRLLEGYRKYLQKLNDKDLKNEELYALWK